MRKSCCLLLYFFFDSVVFALFRCRKYSFLYSFKCSWFEEVCWQSALNETSCVRFVCLLLFRLFSHSRDPPGLLPYSRADRFLYLFSDLFHCSVVFPAPGRVFSDRCNCTRWSPLVISERETWSATIKCGLNFVVFTFGNNFVLFGIRRINWSLKHGNILVY